MEGGSEQIGYDFSRGAATGARGRGGLHTHSKISRGKAEEDRSGDTVGRARLSSTLSGWRFYGKTRLG